MTCGVAVEGLRVAVGDKVILDVDRLTLDPGRLHVVIGPNGAGKTTMLRAMAGIIRYQGRVRVCNVSPRDARASIAYMPSHLGFMEWARVEDVIEAYGYGASAWSPRLDLLPQGVDPKRRIGGLSSGEKRLVQLAGALSRRPRLLIADEPLSFLDVRNKIRVLNVLQSVLDEATVIASMHDLEYISIADTVTLLSEGRIVYHGPPDGLSEDEASRVYGVRMKWVEVDGRRVLLPVF